MKNLFKLLPFLVFFTLFAAVITGKVIGISDGDTVTVLVSGNQQVKIRLYGVDAPEKNQDFGQRSKQFTSDFCFGKQVSITSHGQDKYGRTIGEVFVNGESLNRALVKNGFAWWYKQYAPNETDLQKLELDARSNKLGLWSQSSPIAPWEFRKASKTPSVNSSTIKNPGVNSGHTLNKSSGIRHNSSCKYYNCKNCEPCGSDDGRACQICSG